MSTPSDGGPIAASINRLADGSLVSVGGLTIRDWFAGMAAQSENIAISIMVASGISAFPVDWDRDVAKGAYRIADAMLAARNEGREG